MPRLQRGDILGLWGIDVHGLRRGKVLGCGDIERLRRVRGGNICCSGAFSLRDLSFGPILERVGHGMFNVRGRKIHAHDRKRQLLRLRCG